ncbi:MAG TPA: MerR family DNA-binding transcriptional regulator, partial [Streptosporangiaceae bacterium]
MESYDWHEAGLTVGQVAERSGARPSALRFYERQGLI